MSALSLTQIGWYARRATRMSPAEMAWRARDQTLRTAWSRRQVQREEIPTILPLSGGKRRFTAVLPPEVAERVTENDKAAVLTAADQAHAG